jgi:hypothetical protein
MEASMSWSAVSVVAAANNYLLPAWMIGFGVWLVNDSRKADRRKENT